MADAAVQTGTIRTRIPARLDRLPWSRFHWRILVGLGTVWILDGLEVTMVGTVASRITEKGSSLAMTPGDIGIAGAIYIIGACLGALYFGHLTDRFGRKKLFMLTLGIYIVATFATAFAFAPWWFFLARFFTGAGIGGEYAAINSAIDELIPARVRGRVDLVINGTYWAGSAAGSALALVFLNEAWIPGWLGWRLAFGIGVLLGLAILLVRRHVPESPRWLFIHGREEDAERIVDGIERDVVRDTGEDLERVEDTLTVRQRSTIPFRSIAHTAFKLYPRRAVLGIALFVGQAFIYNGITFNLGTLFTQFYDVSSSFVPIFVIIYAVGNLLGPLTLGRLFDTVGRKPMISGTYLGSALVTIPLGLVFLGSVGGEWLLIILVVVTFFLASAGASAAYLTVSEIFPMETRALAIAFFYAIGTAAGGIAGPLLFGQLIGSGDRALVMLAFFIGAAVMAVGGVTEILFGVRAERASLESIAQPLTVAEAEEGEIPGEQAAGGAVGGDPGGDSGSERAGGRAMPAGPGTEEAGRVDDPVARAAARASECREEAEWARARAADYRAQAIEAATERSTEERVLTAETLAEVEELRAQELEQQAIAADELADPRRPGAMWRAEAADQRARSLAEHAAALSSADETEAAQHRERAEAAAARARSREQLAAAEAAESSAAPGDGGRSTGDGQDELPPSEQAVPAAVARARAAAHRAWSEVDERRAAAHVARATGDVAAEQYEQAAAAAERRALAAEERIAAAEHHAAAEELRAEREAGRRRSEQEARAAREREQEARARSERIRARLMRRQAAERGVRQWRPGPGPGVAPLWAGAPASSRAAEEALDREIDVIARALSEHGAVKRGELARMVGARYWGPGRFGAALDGALDEGRARRVARGTFGPADTNGQGPADTNGQGGGDAGGQGAGHAVGEPARSGGTDQGPGRPHGPGESG